MSRWHPFPIKAQKHTVVGTVLEQTKVYSPQLDNYRPIYTYLPPSYQTQPWKRYPVVYMHDGQNLFDEQTSYLNEWCVDETMEQFAREGHEAIIVGIANALDERINEYAPVTDERLGRGGKGDAYLDFLFETIKPMIDSEFRTQAGPDTTALAGSSMGGLISLYGFLRNPETVGLAACLSSSLWFGQQDLFALFEQFPHRTGRLYLDIGWLERDDDFEEPHENTMLSTNRAMHALLQRQGYSKKQLMYLEDRKGTHTEKVWARRFPFALRFLFGW
jgi:predicted alpha/beta superfamily hydrolase